MLGDAEQREGLDLTGAFDMGAAAKVDEVAVAVDADLFPGGKLVDELDFVDFAPVGKEFQGFLAREQAFSKGRFSLTIFFISAAMRPRSSSEMGAERSKS